MIHLREDWGIEEWVLDYVRPTIRITELVSHQKNCASEYQICAKLLRRDMGYDYDPRFYLDPKFHSHCKMEKRVWSKDSDCGRGDPGDLRIPYRNAKLSISSGGRDLENTEGHHGLKIARLQVEVVLPPEGPRVLPPQLWEDDEEKHFLKYEPFTSDSAILNLRPFRIERCFRERVF
ncbi:unnamed protein product [Caenorhabditis auriculariae]|uniref:FBA domain-containing protein n=1 Tax=Caenorhabditis auriculariae TaxID=2777116 RepID=A0A8S1GV86_9PELO|nr:unnamed protein product [Caenorhabditis auriculariae]